MVYGLSFNRLYTKEQNHSIDYLILFIVLWKFMELIFIDAMKREDLNYY